MATFANELINHIMSFRPVHPVAKLIKDKYQEYYYYRLPSGSPVWDLDETDGVVKRFSAPLIRHCSTFLNRGKFGKCSNNNKHGDKCGNNFEDGKCGECEECVSFNEWILYFEPNAYDLWGDVYRHW